MTTFCWLPPDRFLTSVRAMSRALIWTEALIALTSPSSRARSIMPDTPPA